MEKRNVVLNEEKLKEYNALIKIIKETVGKEDFAKICLNSKTLRERAGYEGDLTEDEINPYVREYLDKLAYDEHNKEVEEAKKLNDKNRLQLLSNKIMDMAGYVKDGSYAKSGRINKYAKSFVDRTLIDRELSKLYKAVDSNDLDTVDEVYRRIYQMSSYGENQPFGVVNECAQGFVDSRIDRYIQKGIHVPEQKIDQRYAI